MKLEGYNNEEEYLKSIGLNDIDYFFELDEEFIKRWRCIGERI